MSLASAASTAALSVGLAVRMRGSSSSTGWMMSAPMASSCEKCPGRIAEIVCAASCTSRRMPSFCSVCVGRGAEEQQIQNNRQLHNQHQMNGNNYRKDDDKHGDSFDANQLLDPFF